MNFNRKLKLNKSVIVFLIIYSFISLFFILISNNTTGRYTATEEGNDMIQVAAWQVKVNDNDIISQNTYSNIFSLEPLPAIQTSNNKIAPGAKGYFDVIINPEGAEVSMQYSIKIDTTKFPKGLEIKEYEILETGIKSAYDSTDIVSEISLSEELGALTSDNIQTVRIFWEYSQNITEIPNENDEYNFSVLVSVQQKI